MCTGDADNGTVWLDGKEFVLNKDGQPCHERAQRGAKTGTQGIKDPSQRAVVAHGLSLETCLASEVAFYPNTKAVKQAKLNMEFVRAVHTAET